MYAYIETTQGTRSGEVFTLRRNTRGRCPRHPSQLQLCGSLQSVRPTLQRSDRFQILRRGGGAGAVLGHPQLSILGLQLLRYIGNLSTNSFKQWLIAENDINRYS